MLNKEKYKEEIWNFILEHGHFPAITKDGFKNCQIVHCRNDGCVFYRAHSNCEEGLIEWLNSEYKEPEIDWSKVPVDTPILVSKNNEDWYNRYFAKIENGNIYAWNNGRTSWSTDDTSEVTSWKFAKLANEADVEKYKKESK